MASFILLAFAAWLTYIIGNNILSLRRNVALARQSGLPYVVTPVFSFYQPWMIIAKPVTRLLRLLPVFLQPAWIPEVQSEQAWERLFSQFEKHDTRTYLIVSPGKIAMWTANAEAIATITQRRLEFPKPITVYRAVDVYGKNIVSTEGAHWRRQRKTISPSFSEQNNYLVWHESIHQAECMIKDWTGSDGNSSRTIKTVAHDCMRLSLHVISLAGFGKRLIWPGVETEGDGIHQGPESGHEMTYTEAIEGLLENLLFVVGIPKRFLRILPFKRCQAAYKSQEEWGKYMSEMMEEKKLQLSSGETKSEDNMDLMGALVKSAGYGSNSKSDKEDVEHMTDQEILGNAFVFILAGHETTANTLHYAFILLATEIAEQRKLQRDIDSIFQGKPSSEWDYEEFLPHIFGGMVGAVMNETLRVIPPANNIPKSTQDWQPLKIDGKEYQVPPNTYIHLTVSAVHRNPRYWPVGPPPPIADSWNQFSSLDNDLNEFRPSRWLSTDGNLAEKVDMPNRDLSNAEAENLGINTAADTSDTLFKPTKGAYIPFSEGFRSCIGRRFAQVEVLVVLARIMAEYSVELAVDEFASDEEVAVMTENEKEVVWRKARQAARHTLATKPSTIITLQLRSGDHVSLRFVRRGKEQFNFTN